MPTTTTSSVTDRQLSHRERLTKFYQTYNPSKVPDVEAILASFEGREDDMYDYLVRKYVRPAVASSATDSSPYRDRKQHDLGCGIGVQEAVEITASKRARALLDRMRSTLTSVNQMDEEFEQARVGALATLLGDKSSLEGEEPAEETFSDTTEGDGRRERKLKSRAKQKKLIAEASGMVASNAKALARGTADILADAIETSEEWYSAFQRSSLRGKQINVDVHTRDEDNEMQGPTIAVSSADVAMPQIPSEARFIEVRVDDPRAAYLRGAVTAAVQQSRTGDVIHLPRGVEMLDEAIVVDGNRHLVIQGRLDEATGLPTPIRSKPGHCVLEVRDTSRLLLRNVALVEASTEDNADGTSVSSGATQPCAVLLTGSSCVNFNHVQVTGGRGGILVHERSAIKLRDCSVQHAGFAGVYVRDRGFASLHNTAVLNCEIGVRVRDGTLEMQRCDVKASLGDGIVCSGAARCLIERCCIVHSHRSGVAMQSPNAEMLLTSCTLRENSHHGVLLASPMTYTPPILLGEDREREARGPVTVQVPPAMIISCEFAGNGYGDYHIQAYDQVSGDVVSPAKYAQEMRERRTLLAQMRAVEQQAVQPSTTRSDMLIAPPHRM